MTMDLWVLEEEWNMKSLGLEKALLNFFLVGDTRTWAFQWEGPVHKLSMGSCLAQRSSHGCVRSDVLVCVQLCLWLKLLLSCFGKTMQMQLIALKGHRINMTGEKIIIWKWNCSICFCLPGRDWWETT